MLVVVEVIVVVVGGGLYQANRYTYIHTWVETNSGLKCNYFFRFLSKSEK